MPVVTPQAPTQGSATTTQVNSAATAAKNKANEAEDRFLRLLVTQIQNQDPLNPMDNAQVTTQMAQIQTVSGIEKLNTSVVGLNTQFAQLQALSGASLVGRSVLVEGNRMTMDEGLGHAGFELSAQADRVRVEVLDGAGRVLDTLELGAMPLGRHGFEWTPATPAAGAQAARFRVTATLGAANVTSMPLTRDRINAVSSSPEGLNLELDRAGLVPYDSIKVFD